ncbi:ROK family protein [Pseudoalteromonas aurantia]|uniref:Glucokinase n=1 Tax=Pseudoalteromonas aurantia 208 TaxID=1314867 RepID=A0ABR9EAC0_9GAMM|nr:ROK family protein [Pseudoalteromonas aurantia]MBE0367932.1 glucokinase [Pseudoalteromonas aurantia 208]
MSHIICIDLGGTKAHVAQVSKSGLGQVYRHDVPRRGTKQEVNDFIEYLVESNMTRQSTGIAIGVPSAVRISDGHIIDTVNIPNWHDVSLKHNLMHRFCVETYVQNDANCFTLGEYYYGPHLPTDNLVGVTLGTGLGSGIVLNGALYTGRNGFAGEFGSFPYLDGIIEDYTSGQFFKRFATDGAKEAEKANLGDLKALNMFVQLGEHLGNALAHVLLAFDPDKIVLGGSVAHSFPLFSQSMFSTLKQRSHSALAEHVQVQPSRLQYAPLLGAYAGFTNQLIYSKELSDV